jgi:hypothetical protein
MPTIPNLHILHTASAWGGNIIVSREMHDPVSGDYRHYEAHECKGQDDIPDGCFRVATWVPEGNNGDAGVGDTLDDVIRGMLALPVPEGWVEETIPEWKLT